MTTFTEGRHAAEFILDEWNDNYTRDNGLLKVNEDLPSGALLMDDGTGDLVAFTSELTTEGGLANTIAGILIYPEHAVGADKPVAYVARGPVLVSLKALSFPVSTEDVETPLVVAALKALGIVAR